MQRLEFCSNPQFQSAYRVYINGRSLDLRRAGNAFLSGLRYRRTNLYPSMHPGIPTQLPLLLTLLDRASGRPAAQFELNTNDIAFRPARSTSVVKLSGRPCRGGRKSDFTCDLRLE